MKPLNLFYEEPEHDRWLPLDRFPRRVIRRALRGKPRPGGQMRVFLNLCQGLRGIGVPYRVNDYKYARRHPEEVACIIGKPHVLDRTDWQNPVLFGAAVFSHPSDDPELLTRLPVKKILVPGEWVRKMFEPAYGERVAAWAVGIDTDAWTPALDEEKKFDFLLYDKVRWEHDRYEVELLAPVRSELEKRGLTFTEMRYGFYREEEFHAQLARARAMIFLCEHETQGIAYQQALSCGVPILAWDRGGFWQDPSYFPHKVRFASVSSVPYWDDGCGVKFRCVEEFAAKLDEFLDLLTIKRFDSRRYILQNLTLEICAGRYAEFHAEVCGGSAAVTSPKREEVEHTGRVSGYGVM